MSSLLHVTKSLLFLCLDFKTQKTMEKVVTIKHSEFEQEMRKYTDEGWKVEKTIKVSDSQSQYLLTKPDVSKKIKG